MLLWCLAAGLGYGALEELRPLIDYVHLLDAKREERESWSWIVEGLCEHECCSGDVVDG